MKKIVPLLLFAMIVSAISSLAQTKKETEQDIIAQLCQKWKYKKMSSGKTDLPLPLRFENTFISFKTDGSYIKITDNEETNGYWELDRLTLILRGSNKKETERHRLVSVTGNELILRSNINGVQMSMTLERVE
jgi:hypothetical protein